ncbi:MAG: TIM barrel protein [Gemmatimonadota bacterium]
MSVFALSTGCFIGHEARLERADLGPIELASHTHDTLGIVLASLGHGAARVVGVHCPCPSRGSALDLAADGDRWAAAANGVREAMELADASGARYLVIHAFYCSAADLPADDVERSIALRRPHGYRSISEYIRSDRYMEARERAKRNVKSLLPELRRRFPRQKIVLENLNPRFGYGGIRLEDVAAIAREFDGEVGICLDMGHLALSAAALGEQMEGAVLEARELIWTTHIHENFAGRHFVDRHWNESAPRPALQEVDTHLPLLARYRRLEGEEVSEATTENSAFAAMLDGVVHYTSQGNGELVQGAVPVERLLSLLDPSALRVLEFDSRYAPLDDILAEYGLARQGKHPRVRSQVAT